MTDRHARSDERVGAWIEARALAGLPSRYGQIVEILGRSGHEQCRVRGDEVHESIFNPADGVTILEHARQHGAVS